MRNIILIFKNSILRNKLTVILSLAAAVLMSFIFWSNVSSDGSVYAEDTIVVGVDDQDKSGLSENLAKYLTDSLGVDVTFDDYDSLSALLIDRRISAIIEVPEKFESSSINGTPEKLEVTTLDDYENSAFIEAYLNSYMRGISVISQSADSDAEMFSEMVTAQKSPNTITFSETNSQVDRRAKTKDAYNLSVGFMLMIISGITVFISNQILVDRRLGTFNRMRCSSLRSLEYVIGISLFGVICCTASNLIFNLFAFSVGEQMPVPLGLALAANELFMLFSVGLAVLFALLINEQQALMTVGIGYVVVGSMLGGAWFPMELELGFVGSISKIFPQYWLMDLLRRYPENPDINILPNLLIIALAAVLVYLVSAVIFTRKNVRNG